MSSCRGEPESEESDEEESDDILYGSSPESRMVLRPPPQIPIAHVARPFLCTSYLGPPPPPPANLSKLRTDLISELGQPCQPGQSQTQEEQITVCLENLPKNQIREGQ